MKPLLLITLLFSSLSWANTQRQYIQCADFNSFDRYVINLDGENSTFFYTNGVHLPDSDQIRFLHDLNFVESNNETFLYSVELPSSNLQILVPASEINGVSQAFEVKLNFINDSNTIFKQIIVSCFSSLHNS